MQKICKLTCSKATLAALLLGLLLTMLFALPAEAVAYSEYLIESTNAGEIQTKFAGLAEVSEENNVITITLTNDVNGCIKFKEEENVFAKSFIIDLNGHTIDGGGSAVSYGGAIWCRDISFSDEKNTLTITGSGSIKYGRAEDSWGTHQLIAASNNTTKVYIAPKNDNEYFSAVVKNAGEDSIYNYFAGGAQNTRTIYSNVKNSAYYKYDELIITQGTNVHSISFNTDGGTALADIKVLVDAPIAAFDEPTRNGYIFKGWAEDIPEQMPDSDLTFTAQWEVAPYKDYVISTNSVGEIQAVFGDLAVVSQAGAGEPIVIKLEKDIKGRIKFATNDRLDNDFILDLGGKTIEAGDRKEAILCEHFGLNKTLTLTGNGKLIRGGSADIIRGIRDITIAPDRDNNCNSFTAILSDGTKERDVFGDRYDTYTEAYSEVKTFHPDYVDIGFYDELTITQGNAATVTLVNSYGSENAQIEKLIGEPIGSLPEIEVPSGVIFIGWDPAIPELMPENDITLTAKLVENRPYIITFKNGYDDTIIKQIEQRYGTAIEAPADPTREGYTFAGWDTEIPATMPATDMTITALWRENSGEGDASEPLIDITVSTTPQSVTFTGLEQEFEIISEQTTRGFSVKYKQDGEEVTPINVGTYDVVISRAEDATYSAYNQTINGGLIITKADYVLTSIQYPQASRVSVGSKLSASALSPANVKVAGNVIGTFAWVTPNEVLNEKGTFNKEVKFTITDTQNYNEQTVTFTIPVQVYRESYSGGGGGYYTPSDTVTSTTQNSDGSVTETTVDKTTGTTTTVTTKPDGAKVTVEEKKDGSVTTIEETTIGKVTTDTDGKGNIKSEVELNFDRATDINLPIRDYSDIAKLTVTYEDGTKVDIIDFKKTADGIKINVADDCSVAFNKVVPHNFTDLASDHWATKDIDYISSTGLMRGMTATNFEPNVTLTRGMLVTILYRLENEPAVNTNMGFIDVDLAQYYVKAVAWAKANGIVNGVSEDRFAPDSQITREQMAAIMCNYAEHKGYDISVGENTNILSYDDFSNISEYAIASMQYAAGSGLFKGRTPSTINPQDTATRAETAAILHRFVENNR